jgi:hypothetical protein
MKSKTVYGFDKSGGVPLLALHTFETSSDGQLIHLIDGNVRAIVPPEGWADYVQEWPEAQDIVDALRRVPNAVAAPSAQEVSMAEQIAALQATIASLQGNQAPA